MLLAQSRTGGQFSDSLKRIVDYIRDFDFPSRDEYLADIAALDKLVAVALVLGGICFLMFGFKYFKLFVIANGALAGGLAGMYLGTFSKSSQNMPLLLGLAGAVLMGALAIPLLKYAVCLMGGAAGGLVGYGLARFLGHALHRPTVVDNAWVGGVVGLIVVGMLAWIAFKMAVMVFTSVQGGVMLVSGLLAFVLTSQGLRDAIEPTLRDNRVVIYVLLGLPAALGFAYQESDEIAKVKKKRKDTEKPPA